jgi:hypothetical protein
MFIVSFSASVSIAYLHSSESVDSSCSRSENICTISVMMSGHMEVTCEADIRTRTTLKQRKTAARTLGELGMVRRLSTMRSKRKKRKGS